jgi:hypothetical protein
MRIKIYGVRLGPSGSGVSFSFDPPRNAGMRVTTSVGGYPTPEHDFTLTVVGQWTVEVPPGSERIGGGGPPLLGWTFGALRQESTAQSVFALASAKRHGFRIVEPKKIRDLEKGHGGGR